MSFGTATQTFAAQASRHRRESFPTMVQPAQSGTVALDVFLGSVRAEVELTDHGPVTIEKAVLRVEYAAAWVPANDGEFTVTEAPPGRVQTFPAGTQFRINSTASHPSSGEYVCDCAKISR